jgi:hypothetical protein
MSTMASSTLVVDRYPTTAVMANAMQWAFQQGREGRSDLVCTVDEKVVMFTATKPK